MRTSLLVQDTGSELASMIPEDSEFVLIGRRYALAWAIAIATSVEAGMRMSRLIHAMISSRVEYGPTGGSMMVGIMPSPGSD